MISEGSCNYEDKSYYAENSHHRNKLHFKIFLKQNLYQNTLVFFHNIPVLTVFFFIN